MTRLRKEEAGIAAAATLVIVLGSVAVSTFLLGRTMGAATSINDKAERILSVGRGINSSTDAVLQLTRTNELASSILDTAKPLEGQLDQVVSLAARIDGLAKSINATAGAVNNTARGINTEAAAILGTARNIDVNVQTINDRLVRTISLARAIKSDTGNILKQAKAAHHNASQIDCRIGADTACDGH